MVAGGILIQKLSPALLCLISLQFTISEMLWFQIVYNRTRRKSFLIINRLLLGLDPGVCSTM